MINLLIPGAIAAVAFYAWNKKKSAETDTKKPPAIPVDKQLIINWSFIKIVKRGDQGYRLFFNLVINNPTDQPITLQGMNGNLYLDKQAAGSFLLTDKSPTVIPALKTINKKDLFVDVVKAGVIAKFAADPQNNRKMLSLKYRVVTDTGTYEQTKAMQK